MFRQGEFADLVLIVLLIMTFFSVLPMYTVYVAFPKYRFILPVLVLILHMSVIVPYIVKTSSESENFIGKYIGIWYVIFQIILLIYVRHKVKK